MWNPERYLEFQAQRFLPFEDAVRLVTVRPGLKVVDLGCGTGALTRKLGDHLPQSDVLGIDDSETMLAKTAEHVRPGVRFELQSIEKLLVEHAHDKAGVFDLVFSHAAIHWVEDHEKLVPHLLHLAKPGGQLVVQLPSNHVHPAHLLLHDVAREAPFSTLLSGWTRTAPVLPIDRYAEVLHAAGGEALTVIEKIYPHLLESTDALVDWMSGTTIVPYFERLPKEHHAAFVDRYRERLRALLPVGRDGLFHPFRRTLFCATRA